MFDSATSNYYCSVYADSDESTSVFASDPTQAPGSFIQAYAICGDPAREYFRGRGVQESRSIGSTYIYRNSNSFCSAFRNCDAISHDTGADFDVLYDKTTTFYLCQTFQGGSGATSDYRNPRSSVGYIVGVRTDIQA